MDEMNESGGYKHAYHGFWDKSRIERPFERMEDGRLKMTVGIVSVSTETQLFKEEGRDSFWLGNMKWIDGTAPIAAAPNMKELKSSLLSLKDNMGLKVSFNKEELGKLDKPTSSGIWTIWDEQGRKYLVEPDGKGIFCISRSGLGASPETILVAKSGKDAKEALGSAKFASDQLDRLAKMDNKKKDGGYEFGSYDFKDKDNNHYWAVRMDDGGLKISISPPYSQGKQPKARQ